MLGSPAEEEERFAVTPLSENVTSSVSWNLLPFVKITSTLFAPLLASISAEAPEVLPTPTSPTIRSELSPAGPLNDAKVRVGTVGAPDPEDSNTAVTLTTSGTPRDISLS